MPELPEVEAARRAVEENCLGKKIKKAVIANDPKVVDGVTPSDFEAALLGKTVIAAHRKGKNLWLQLDSPPFPSFQFGMAGAIYIKGVAVTTYKRSAVKDTDEWPSKYSKFFVELDDGLELSFTDKRRFAKVRFLPDPAAVPPISELGPDALLEPMTIDEFIDSLSKKKIAIKALLLDQSYMAGIGNWIADEVLYQARIHPLQIAASLSKENCATLHKCINEVIQYAVRVDAECSRFPPEWLFHFRWGKRPGKVNGKKIDFINAGGRTTAYVPELQKLIGNQAAKALGEPKKRTSKRKGGGNGDDDIDEPADEKEIIGSEKLKKGPKPRGRGEKPTVKTKPKDNDDNESSDDDNADGGGAAANDSDDSGVQRKNMERATTNKRAKTEKTSKKKVATRPKSKKAEKKAK
ncbi:formamidopyrimidine-DNA glycosylase isoform X2 [Carya illinoinensis]|uniref:formamidopyrimidine-DNA glycosylase isoform X2 n=1 Tax=Carya illinoinensis TaxID=32201 RepID=UPI001C71D955|nr:formamidopyrimidine-DNA glycosylase isoform X2 [Carya illinoinensis]